MGRSGGSSTEIFDTKEECDKWLKEDKSDNDAQLEMGGDDTTDSGWGDSDAYGNYKVLNVPTLFDTKQNAENKLSEIATLNNRGDFSKVIVVAQFTPLTEESKQKIELEVEQFIVKNKELSLAPYGRLNIVKDSLVSCSKCESVINMKFEMLNKRFVHGVCPICCSNEIQGVVTRKIYKDAVGKYPRYHDDITGSELKRKRTLYSDEYVNCAKKAETKYRDSLVTFGKRRKKLLKTSDRQGHKYMAVSEWTSAHF